MPTSQLTIPEVLKLLDSLFANPLMYTWTHCTSQTMEMAAANVQESLSLEEQIARLQALLEASRQVHSTIAVQDVLEQTASILVRELEFDGAVFLAPGTVQLIAFYGELLHAPYEGCARFNLASKDGVPLAELVVRKGGSCELSLYEQDFVEGLVLQAGVALENATFHERDVQWARVQQDLDAARNIQRSLLPKAMPVIPGLSISTNTVTCYEVGGDYLDIFKLPDGSYLFTVADVAGKGLASAIMATSFRAAFRSLASQPMPLVELINRVGQLHWEEGVEARRRYVTAIFVRLDLNGNSIEVVNAGHNPGALLSPSAELQMIEASGTPLGLLPGMSYAVERFDFNPGARLLLYTDGLTEVFCDEEEFGSDRLTDAFSAVATDDAKQTIDALWGKIESFSSGGPQTDDMTAMVLCHNTPASDEEATA